MEEIATANEAVARFDTMTQDAAARLKETKNEADGLPTAPRPLGDTLTLPQLQQRLAEAEADVLRNREGLAKLNSEVAARQTRQREVPLELDAARKELADVRKQLATGAPDGELPLLTRARQLHLRTQEALLTARILALEKELPAYAATAELLPKQRDLAGAKLSLAEATQKALLERIDQLRRRDVRSQVDEARLGMDRAPAELKPIAKTTLDYVSQNQAILRQLATTVEERSNAEQVLSRVKQEFQRTREKVETVGLTDALGILLRNKRGVLTSLRGQHHPDRARRAVVQELQLELLQLEDTRMDLTQLEAVTTTTLDELNVDASDLQLRTTARTLLASQREALDSLLQNQRDYFEALVALDSAERELVQQIDLYASYIEGWILWVRSVPPVGRSDLQNAIEAVRWLSSPTAWRELGVAIWSGLRGRLVLATVCAVLFVALVWRQKKFRVRLREIGEFAAPRRCREFSVTVEAVVLTILMAAVWPTLLFFTGWQLAGNLNTSVTAQSLGWACVASGAFLLLTESVRQVLRSQGLAASHFGWPEKARKLFVRQLRWFSLTTPLVFLVVFLRTQPNALFDQSLGRLCFLALMVCVALLAFRTLRPSGDLFEEIGERDAASVSFWLRYPLFFVAIGMPCLLLVLATMGYYYTASQLAQRLLGSVAMAAVLVTVMGLLLRAVLIHRRRLTFVQKTAARQRAAQGESGDSVTDFLTEAETAVDMVQVTRQTRELVRVTVVVAAVLGGWWIWNDVLPALEFLASVEVWRINLPTRIEIITLKHICMSLLAFGLTFICVKNVPGLLELLFLQRLPLDTGARYAVTTIVRYLLTVIGVIIGFGFIQVQWSEYGWLVAAATVGLGFGLQEIFGNFVAGLIVLLERPIRVGDVVTVDGVTGVVQQIHMRATVLKNWDHQELIVPNKDFVTTKILNWTLSNATNRVVINVGVAYGSNVEVARELLLQVVAENAAVLTDPSPSVTFEEFGDSSLNYVVRCYLPQLDGRLGTINDLHATIYQRLNAAGIEISFPQRDLHLRTLPPEWRPSAAAISQLGAGDHGPRNDVP